MNLRRSIVGLLAGLLLAGCGMAPTKCAEPFALYNYKQVKYEWRCEMPKDFREYIPQGLHEQTLYDFLVKMGDEPIDAARKVLDAVIGDGPESTPNFGSETW